MAHGGPRSRAGRPKGARNRRTVAACAAVSATGAATPLAYAISVMNDANAAVERRDRMAALAMPYLHSKLTPVAWLPDASPSLFGEPVEKDAALAMVRRLMRKPKRAAVNGGTPNALEEDR